MKAHFSNAVYGVLDYIAYPAGMLIVAPIALRGLGVERYGVWMVANAALSLGAVAASGFGDANIRIVSAARGSEDGESLTRAVQSTMVVHILLGAAIAAAGWMLSPLAAAHIVPSPNRIHLECLQSLRIASVLMLLRALETVCVSTQRAFERYGAAIGASLVGRLLTLLAAAALSLNGYGVVGIMLATASLQIASLIVQFLQTRHLVPALFRLSFDFSAIRILLSFGVFSWIQAVNGVLFGQADRLIAGLYAGAASVAAYAMCAQLAQPIYGIAAAGLHFVFPYISARSARHSTADLRRVTLAASGANLLVVLTCALPLAGFGDRILALWGGHSIADAGHSILSFLVWSSAAQALSVAGCYTLLALGHFRIVTLLNLLSGGAMVLAALWLVPKFGIAGMALARLLCGPAALLVYVPLVFMLRIPRMARAQASLCEEVKS